MTVDTSMSHPNARLPVGPQESPHHPTNQWEDVKGSISFPDTCGFSPRIPFPGGDDVAILEARPSHE